MTTPEDQRANETLVTGALMALLMLGSERTPEGASVEVVMEAGEATNELYLRLPFMKSRYRLTVTFDPEEADGASADL